MSFRKIFLVGLPASGKTTFARELAVDLQIRFIDLDEEITRSEVRSVTEIFEQEGEDYFREIEKKQLEEIISLDDDFVMATGGGTPCFCSNMDLMNEVGTTVYINPPIEDIKQRLKSSTSRPLMKKYSLDELIARRKQWYEQAHFTVKSYTELMSIFH